MTYRNLNHSGIEESIRYGKETAPRSTPGGCMISQSSVVFYESIGWYLKVPSSAKNMSDPR